MLFLFCGRQSTKIKGLLWEGDGFLLLYKRVDRGGHFTWPRTSDDLWQLVLKEKVDAYFEWAKLKYAQINHNSTIRRALAYSLNQE
ncbi:MAG: transposase [Bacteroidaceae bacterium]|nr:transposase [Bacteroidaceae bacterium]